jgi:diguanylate cyclase (GGDEF)-like protein
MDPLASNEKPTVLVVDDTPANLKLLYELLKDRYTVRTASNGAKAIAICHSEQRPDLVLLDVMMPDLDGYQVCAMLKEDPRSRDIPVIFITARNDIEDEQKGLELGAVDYISKPFGPAVVQMRVRNQIELKRAREQLTRLATTDGLTGLANRRRFDEVLAHECARHARSGAELSLILIDIDHFKAYNDAYGHVSGDDCLRQVARVIGGGVVRSVDLAARYGGEEFVCILPDTDHAGAFGVAEKIRRGIFELAIPHSASSAGGVVSVSIGVATMRLRGERGQAGVGIVALADRQLYRAKSDGRNRVCGACEE